MLHLANLILTLLEIIKHASLLKYIRYGWTNTDVGINQF